MRPVYLHPLRVVTPCGDADATWDAWCHGGAAADERQMAYQGVVDRLLAEVPALPPGSDFLLATTKGDVQQLVHWIRSPRQIAPPTLAAQADGLATRLRLSGNAAAVSAACASGLTAVMDAAMCVTEHPEKAVAVAGVDGVTDFVVEGFTALKALAPVCRPFDVSRAGLTLGFGGALAVVSPEESPVPSSGPPIALLGFGAASDAVHMTAPDREARGLQAAIRHALAMAGLHPGDIDVVIAHGTGTNYNDAMEATAYRAVFGNRSPAITCLKGLIGHSLGASGLVELLLAAEMFHRGIVPGVTGLETPEFADLDLVREVRGLARKPRHILKVAAGFGGLNAAVVIGKGSSA